MHTNKINKSGIQKMLIYLYAYKILTNGAMPIKLANGT